MGKEVSDEIVEKENRAKNPDHQSGLGGLKRDTLAAPDKALVLTPARALYQLGIAPCFMRQFFLGC